MMKKLYFCLLIAFILTTCNRRNDQNSHITETQVVQFVKEDSTATPQATDTPVPTLTKLSITATETAIVEMSTYYDIELRIQISYPSHWTEKSKGMFEGNDGYLFIKKLDNYHSRNLVNVAVDFANTYYPQFAVYCIGNGGVGCTIDFITTEKMVGIIPYRATVNSAEYFSIETTRQHYFQIVHSIIWDDNAFEPTLTPYPTSLPNPTEINLEGISLVEEPSSNYSVEELSLDYQKNVINSPLVEIRGDYCGTLTANNNLTLVSDNFGRMQIQRDGKTIYHFSSWGFSESPPWTFCQWNESWVLETQEIVVVNGSILNHKTGFDEIFGWHLLGKKPAYFVKIGDKYSISIDGKLLPIKYDEIEHYECCEGHGSNPHTNGVNTAFMAKRGGVWYKVLITVQ